VAGITVDEFSTTQNSTIIEWHTDPSLNATMEFLPSICEVESKKCVNSSDWISDKREFEFGGEKFPLHSHTKYSVTVYVKLVGKDKIYPPGVYKTFFTEEDRKLKILNVLF